MEINQQKFHGLLESNRILSSTRNLSELLRKIMSLATELVEAETSSILLYDKENKELFFSLALTDKEATLKEVRLKIGEGIAGYAAAEKKPLIVNDVSSDRRWASCADHKTNFCTRSALAVPLIYNDELLGVLEAINKKNGCFKDEDIELLESFSAQAAVAVNNARIFENLQEEKNKIESVFSQMSDGAIFFDIAGKKLFANQSAEKLLGKENISQSDVFKIFADFNFVPALTDILQEKEKSILVELSRISDKTLYLQGTISRILNTLDNVLGFIFIFRDVTSEKKETLLKRNFMSLISHKLRTPLVSILGYGPLILMDGALTEMQKKAINSISNQGSYLKSLVDKLLYFTIIDNESLELNKKQNLFMPLIENAVSSLRQYLQSYNTEIKISDEIKQLSPVQMDGEKIELVILNLIENAVKFNKKPQKIVEIGPALKSGFIGIYVKDNGPGIHSEEREKIFDKFYQIEEIFTGQVEGAGLGLAIVKRIVEGHGGYVFLDSIAGEGSTFYFFLPAN